MEPNSTINNNEIQPLKDKPAAEHPKLRFLFSQIFRKLLKRSLAMLLRLLRRLQIVSRTCKRTLKIRNLPRRVIQMLLIKIRKVKMKMIRSGRLLSKDSRKLVRTHSLARV